MKHLYIYLAPAYFIFLLRHYCLKNSFNYKNLLQKIYYKNFLILGSTVLCVFVATFGPFIGHLNQVCTIAKENVIHF